MATAKFTFRKARVSGALAVGALTFGAPVIGMRALAGEPPVQAPVLAEGDRWVFDETIEKGQTGFDERRMDEAVERLDGDTMVVGVKREGSPASPTDHMLGQDWSQLRVVDGRQTVTTRPFEFPLRVGKTWSIDYVDPTRRGTQVSNHVRRTYRVVGWEDVRVPAGTFRALKVEAKGIDEAQVDVPSVAVGGAAAEPGAAASFTRTARGGRSRLVRGTYAALYYVPSIGTYAKSVEEQYDTDNVRIVRITQVLVSSGKGGT